MTRGCRRTARPASHGAAPERRSRDFWEGARGSGGALALQASPAGSFLPARLSRVDTGARSGRAAYGFCWAVAAAAACAVARPRFGGDSGFTERSANRFQSEVCWSGACVPLRCAQRRSRTPRVVSSVDTDAEGRESPDRTITSRRSALAGMGAALLSPVASVSAFDLPPFSFGEVGLTAALRRHQIRRTLPPHAPLIPPPINQWKEY